MSFLRFHSSASSGTLRGESASNDAFRSARASSDTTEDDEDRAAASAAKMDPAATYAVIVALFFAAGVLEIGARPRGNQHFTTPSTRLMDLQVADGCGGRPCGRASRGGTL